MLAWLRLDELMGSLLAQEDVRGARSGSTSGWQPRWTRYTLQPAVGSPQIAHLRTGPPVTGRISVWMGECICLLCTTGAWTLTPGTLEGVGSVLSKQAVTRSTVLSSISRADDMSLSTPVFQPVVSASWPSPRAMALRAWAESTRTYR